MTVGEMEARMSAREFIEWQIYSNLEPFGQQREDFRAGQICAVTANVMGAGKKKQLTATDFIPLFTSEKTTTELADDEFSPAQEAQIALFKGLAEKRKRREKALQEENKE